VLSLQNGIGPEEILARYLPKQRILRGVTAQGATLVEPGVIRWAGQGSTRFGSLVSVGPPAQHEILQLVEVFRQAGIEAHNVERVEPLLWEKLLINAAINPLTALFGIPNGVLLEDSALRLILREVVSETRCIVASHGVQLSSEQAMERVEGVCRATAENLSSMLQDVQRGKRTEIDFINGVVVREGERLGIATPLNRLLTQLVLTRSVWKTPAGSGEQQCV
jgi:2-dehydropantoate 2-reductase